MHACQIRRACQIRLSVLDPPPVLETPVLETLARPPSVGSLGVNPIRRTCDLRTNVANGLALNITDQNVTHADAGFSVEVVCPLLPVAGPLP
jgi:hypothetical protein